MNETDDRKNIVSKIFNDFYKISMIKNIVATHQKQSSLKCFSELLEISCENLVSKRVLEGGSKTSMQ